MTFEVAIFGNFPDIPELKVSLPFWVMEGRMWRYEYYVSVKSEARRSLG